MLVTSLHPTRIWHDDRELFDDPTPVVALGPAAIGLLDAVTPGANGTLRIRMQIGPSEAVGPLADVALALQFTTPRLRQRFGALDLAEAQLLLAAALARTDAEQALVAAAAAAVPPLEQLTTGDPTPALGELADRLAPVLARAADYTVWCIGHSHIDLAWMWQWSDTREVIKRDVRSVLGLMADYPEFRFTHSQPAGYRVIEEDEPELFEQIRALVAEGRWEPATMQWVEADSNLASGPASARQLLEGVHYTEHTLGVRPRVHLAPDTFGHAGNLPQLTTSAGAEVYYHHRGNPGIAGGGQVWPAYWWYGDDGTRLLTISSPVYLGPFTAARVVRDVISMGLATGRTDVCYWYGVGDHGGGPTRIDLETIRRLSAVTGFPTLRCATVGEFADAVRAADVPLPERHGESMTVFQGCYVSHADSKRANRDGENTLVTAEALAALSGVAPDGLTGAWREVLFNQFHDILCGSSVRAVYDDQRDGAAEVAAIAGRVIDAALEHFTGGLPAGSWAVTNPLGHGRRGPVELPPDAAPAVGAITVTGDGAPLAAQRTETGGIVFVTELESFATKGFQVESSTEEPAGPIQVGTLASPSYAGSSYYTIDTPHFFALLRRDCGVITTLYDKARQRELVANAGQRAGGAEQVRPDLGLGVLQLLDEHPHTMTSWVTDEIWREESLLRGATTRIVEQGPVRVVFETAHRARESSITVRTTFWAELAKVDLEVVTDWQQTGSPGVGVPGLAISFTTRQDEVSAAYETPFGAATRPADGLLVPALRWADVGSGDYGVAVLNDGKYGHETLGSRVRVHLVRGSYDPDPLGDLSTDGRVDRCRFTVLPHAGGWQDAGVVQAAAAHNVTPLVRRVTERRPADAVWRPVLTGDPGVVLAEVKHAADGRSICLRIYEATGRPGTARLGEVPTGAGVWAATLTEDRGEPVEIDPDGTVVLKLRAYEVVTLLVDRDTAPTLASAEGATS